MRTLILPIALLSLIILPVLSDRISFQRTRNPSGMGSSFLVQTSSLRNVPINSTDQVGFYVDVDLANGADSLKLFSKNEAPFSAAMIVALYSSNTLLASTCQKFNPYNCEKFQCKDSKEVMKSDYPYFSAQGHAITANMILEKSSWILNSNAIYATTCTGNTAADYGFDVYGIVGLGIDNLAAKNYRKKDLQFSIFLHQNLTQGELIFAKDFSKTTSETPVATFPADNNWHVPNEITVEIANEFGIRNLQTKLIFDLHAEVIGFPLSWYGVFLEKFAELTKGAKVECPKGEKSYFKPVCHFTEGVPVFPNISVIVREQELVIPPDVYVEYVKKDTGSVKLNIKALSTTLEGENYVTPSYGNYIILDSTVLGYYYTVFEVGAETGKNTIAFYTANRKTKDNSNSLVAYIVLGVFVVLLLFFAFLTYSSYMKKIKAREGLFTNSSLFDQAKKGDYSIASSTG